VNCAITAARTESVRGTTADEAIVMVDEGDALEQQPQSRLISVVHKLSVYKK
jgi:hypothetical protein